MNIKFTLLLLGSILLNASSALAQSGPQLWSKMNESNIPALGTRYIQPSEYRTFGLDLETLDALLVQAPTETIGEHTPSTTLLTLPNALGNDETFAIYYSPIMEQPLADMFPEIRTYAGYSQEGSYIRLDRTPQGFHAMVWPLEGDVWFIDPYAFGLTNPEHYIIYQRKHHGRMFPESMNCLTVSDSAIDVHDIFDQHARYGDCQHRNYRLALSATGEYTAFHGGTVALAQAAQVTSMNRVNGVFERDLAIRMTIIGNNNLIVYTNAGTDPFTNGTPGTMINENQTNTNSVIGSANYDIGHVFGTNSGGLAQLFSPCSGNKARGVTGSGAPIGDSFDIDYVAHEMGHQFGANHTQNNPCNSVGSTSMEPGSAATIMGYAGICAPNIQSNSDDYFHAISLQEMGNFITGAGNACAQVTGLANSAPVITADPGNITVPASTPFALTASATDPNSDPILYCWEQMDPTAATMPPVATSTAGPNFRSFDPSLSPTRYFPNLSDLASGAATAWEVLSSVSRTMPFRVSIRDYASGGGCTDHSDILITIDGSSGPFVVTYPTATGISWVGNTNQTVTWNVAGTAAGAVACANVDIFLSTDGGLTYPVLLANNVANDGSQSILVPNTPSTTARIMVMCANGSFFDISNNNFTITAATFDYTLGVTSSSVSVCQPNNAVFNVNIGSIGGYSDVVDLSLSGNPAGTNVGFSVDPVVPGNSSVLTISNTNAAVPGNYALVLQGNSTSGIKTINLTLSINTGTPGAPSNIAPANGATGVSLSPTLSWNASATSPVTYTYQVATDAGFTSIVQSNSGVAATSVQVAGLATLTTYYWRVRTDNACASSAYASSFSFTTGSCVQYNSSNVPVNISASGTPTVTSTLTIPTGGTINDIDVLGLDISHTWINDLEITLQSPTGTVVSLIDQICGNNDDVLINFDDAGAAYGSIPCPPTAGGTFQPDGLLANFNGEDQAGTWTLTVIDHANGDGGSINDWSLYICATPLCADPTVPTLSFVSDPLCPGGSTDLNISGTLNDATAWHVYTTSCGNGAIGNTSGTSFSISPAGNTTYHVRGEGGCVSPGTCATASITVGDALPPTISCPSNTTQVANASCQTGLSDYTGAATTSDNCDAGPTVSQSPAPGTTLSGAGTVQSVTLTSTDASSNSANCSFNVTVADNTAPTVNCAAITQINPSATCAMPDLTGAASVSDNCDASPTIISQSPAAGSSMSAFVGSNQTLTITAIDASGNSGNCSVSIPVVDNLAPTISCPANTTQAANASCSISLSDYTSSAVIGSDCDGSPVLSQSPAPGSTVTGVGTVQTVTITVFDASANSADCSFTVTVSSTAPAQPNAISGLNPACPNSSQTYTVAAVSGAVSYQWSLPAGWTGTSSTNSITVNTTTSGGTLSVAAVNGCAQVGTARTLNVTIINTDDGVPCTVDACDPSNGSVSHTPNNSFCDDGLFCNGAETCHITLGCQSGTPPVIDDGNSCTDDSCDEVNDQVVNTDNTAPCDDGNPNTINDQCVNGTCVGTPIGNVWTGQINTTWGNAGNWSMFVPSTSDDAIIPSVPTGGLFPIIPNGYVAAIRDVDVQSGASITVQNGGALDVLGLLTNNGLVTVLNGASLVQRSGSTLAGSGSYNIQRLGSTDQTFDFWSSPITTHNSVPGVSYRYNSNAGTQDDSDDLPSDPGWSSYNGTMIPGIGYSGSGGGLVSFVGTVNNGNIVKPLVFHPFDNTYSQSTPGTPFNLMGNPYPSAISAASLIASNTDIDGTLYFWDDDNSGGSDYHRNDFAYWNGTGGLGTGAGSVGAPNGFVSSAQGFYVRALNGSATLDFNNSMRVTGPNLQFFHINEEVARMWFSVEKDSMFNQILVGVIEDATSGEDRLYDAVKMHTPNGLSLAAMANGMEHAILAFPPPLEEEIIPLLVNVDAAGTYSFRANTMENMESFQVTFNDVALGTEIPLTEQVPIEVYLEPGEYEGRFFLNYSPNTITHIQNEPRPTLTAYTSGNTLHLQVTNVLDASISVALIDMAGKVVLENVPIKLDNEHASCDISQLGQGIYVVRLFIPDAILSKRIVKLK